MVKSTILNVEILPDQFGNKKIILDILAEDSKGNLYNIEMQRAPTIA
ncbi:PD-(D/E)XK nuclease family transposase, partial [[Eubacterium] hominis]